MYLFSFGTRICIIIWGEKERRKNEIEKEGNVTVIRREIKCGLDSCGSVQGPVEVCCEHGNEFSGSMKCGELLG
jgi:hypothetical protein